MHRQINLTIPINSLGYGMHGMGYYKILKDAGYEVSVSKIGNNKSIETTVVPLIEDLGLLEPIREDMKRGDFDAPNFIVWHSNQFSQMIKPDVPNIGASAFELQPITAEEQAGFDLVDVAVTYSEWGLEQINNPVKTLVHGPIWSTYGLNSGNVPHIPGIENKPIFISPGKWEERKGHPDLVKIITRLAKKDKEFAIFGFWNNIFTGYLNQPLQCLRDKDWIVVQMYNIGNQMTYILELNKATVVLFGHVEKYTDMLGYYKMADGAISLSRGEGWDMPIVDLLGLGIPVLMTNNTAHTEYVNPAFSIDRGILQEANDGIFFRGQGNWDYPYFPECNTKVNHFITNQPIRNFWTPEYKRHFDSVANPANVLKQIETAISMAEACPIKK